MTVASLPPRFIFNFSSFSLLPLSLPPFPHLLLYISLPPQKWTRLWVVAHCQVSPFDSFISYCKKESQWLKNDNSVSKYTLSDFTVSMITTRKHDKVIKIELPSFTIELAFDSQTKMDLYFKLLSKVSSKLQTGLH